MEFCSDVSTKCIVKSAKLKVLFVLSVVCFLVIVAFKAILNFFTFQ